MRHYEAMYIVDAELTDEQLQPVIEKYQNIVTEMGGVAGETGKWEQGRRKLAYEIDGRRDGIYILMNFESGPDVPKELDRVFRISDDVFRHIIVRQNDDEE
jgi:small subunit ribosomal protein S6